MATKISRQTFIQFGVNVNAAADICQFGSPATGSPVYTKVIATLQELSAWTTGWAAETIANNRPFLEDMNAVHYVFSYMIAYILQMGIAEYDAGTTYFLNSVVQYNGIFYSVINDNSGAGISGTLPTNATYWSTLQVSAQYGAWASKSFGTTYQAATDGTVIGYCTGGGTGNVVGYTDSNSSPTTERYQFYNPTSSTFEWGITMPVRKNDYWLVTAAGGMDLYWLPQGS